MADAQIKAVITADDKASGVLKKFGSNVDDIGGKAGSVIAGVGQVAAGVAVAGFAALTGAAYASIKSFEESENVTAQLNAVLKSTGDISGLTRDQLQEQATVLEHMTRFSDEAIGSVQALLLTFTSLSGSTVKQATGVVLDMATALGEDTKSAAIQLGKALQDPVLGITALRRVGVNFSDAQKDVIQRLVDTGQQAKAQQLILKELNTEFGGSAVAAGQTFAGAMDRLKNSLDDVQETAGKTLVEAITPLVQGFASFASSDQFAQGVNFITQALVRFGQIVGQIITASIPVLRAAFEFLRPAFDELWTAITVNLAPALEKLWKEVLVPLAPFVGEVLVVAVYILVDALAILVAAVSFVINVFVALVNFFSKTLPSGLSSANQAIINFFVGIEQWGQRTVNNIIGFFQKLPENIVKALGNVSATVASDIKNSFHQFHIPGFAGGTDYAPGGLALVGERGPELVNLPRGSQVIPNSQISANNSSVINITVQAGAFMGNPSDARKYAQLIVGHINDIAGAKNMTGAQLLGA